MFNKVFRRISPALFSLIVLLTATSGAYRAATIVIFNNDALNVGFNDPTVVAPVGGNTGTTLGQQRLNAFQSAANTWGAALTSSVTITVKAQWSSTLICTSNSAVLGSAGSQTIHSDFTGAPFANTWYGAALANKLNGTDLIPNDPVDPTSYEINATFNVKLGQSGCLTGIFFYLGLDNNHGNNVDLVTVLEHEFAHGLGFQTFTSGSTGAQPNGLFSAYDRFLIDDTSGLSWLQMTNAERVTSALNTNNLAWTGPKVSADSATVLTSGKDSLGKALVFTPNPFQSGSSVSHWTTTAFQNQLMEPAINSDLTHNVTAPFDLTFDQLSDVGWVASPLPNSISKTAGSLQSASVNTAFTTPLSVTVSPIVSGITVTWTAPASGASGTFATTNTRTTTSTTNALGVAIAPTFTANATTGSYSVNATAPGAGSTTLAGAYSPFTLTNSAGSGPTSMTINAGTTPQSATISTAFANALAVTVRDAGNSPVSGVNVIFTAPGSGSSGIFSNAAATITVATNASGIASAPFTANSTAGGSYNVTAAASGLTTVNFALTNNVGAASSMSANVGTTPQSATVNAAFANAPAVTVRDAGNNLVSGATVTFTAPGSVASGKFSNNTATVAVVTNASGVATAPFTANATSGGPYNVTAVVSGVTTVNFAFTNTAGAAASMTMNAGTSPQNATISTAFANALGVTVRDAGSNPVSGVNVTFTAPGAGASGIFSNATATVTVATNASGIASAPFTANSTAGGAYTVTTAVSGLTTVNFSLTNTVGAAAAMSANAGTTPQSAVINTAFGNALAVTVRDAGSNPVPGVNVTLTAPGSGAAGLFANSSNVITVATNASGIASATFTANSTAGGPYAVTAASSGLTAINFSLTNNTGAASSMNANAGSNSQSAVVNTAFANPLAVTVRDAGNNPVSGVNITFTSPGSGTSGVYSNGTTTITIATNVSGIASAPFTANSTAGLQDYAVTAASPGLLTVNFFLRNTPGSPASMTLNSGATPQSSTINTAFPVALSVTIRDSSGNPVPGVVVNYAAPGAGASGTFSNGSTTITGGTITSGISSAPFTANSTAGGPYTVTASASGLTTVSFSLTNIAGAPSSMIANAGTTPQSATINTAFASAPAVTIMDAGNNPVSGVNVTFTAPSSGASGLFGNNTTSITVATDGTGVASAPMTANGTAGGQYTVQALASGLATVGFSLTNVAAAPVPATVTGKVLTSNNIGLKNAAVSITDSNNVVRTAITNSFGSFTFVNVTTGQTYVVKAASKRFRYASQTIQINGDTTLADFVGIE